MCFESKSGGPDNFILSVIFSFSIKRNKFFFQNIFLVLVVFVVSYFYSLMNIVSV